MRCSACLLFPSELCLILIVTPEKRNMVAIGTEDGVWMGFGGETKTFRPVLTGIGNVMQMAVLEEFGIFVVLVGKLRKIVCLVTNH